VVEEEEVEEERTCLCQRNDCPTGSVLARVRLEGVRGIADQPDGNGGRDKGRALNLLPMVRRKRGGNRGRCDVSLERWKSMQWNGKTELTEPGRTDRRDGGEYERLRVRYGGGERAWRVAEIPAFEQSVHHVLLLAPARSVDEYLSGRPIRPSNDEAG
jgi:hypothetical protein